jgi:hypothetical protein
MSKKISPHTVRLDIYSLSTKQLLEHFKTLPAPTLKEMDGEYSAVLLQQPNILARISGKLSINNPLYKGKWLCKAFRPVDAESGRGYNTFQHLGRTKQHFPMHTVIAPSRYDGRPAYQLVYRAFQSMCGDIHMVDEVRSMGDGRYLGIGTWGFSNYQRRIALPFLLTKTAVGYRGDIGTARPGFNLRAEIPALKSKPKA